MWNFDGVACAAALELGNPAYLFHVNHLLYAFVAFLFWKGIACPLGLTRALPALQLFTTLLSGIALVGIFQTLQLLLNRKWLALAVTLLVASTAVYWVWSIEAQVYALGVLGLAFATYTLLRPSFAYQFAWVGFFHGLGVLGHLMHVLWAVPAIFWIYSNHEFRRTAALERNVYLRWLAATITVPYFLVFGFVIRPSHAGRESLFNWLKGSVGLNADRHFQWHSEGWAGPLLWLRTTAQAVWGNLWAYAHRPGALEWTLFALSATSLVALLVLSIRRTDTRLKQFALLWIGVYGLLLWTWEPSTLCYRMSEAIPFALLVGGGLTQLASAKRRNLLLGTAILSTAALTLMSRIKPMSRDSLNPLYRQTLALAAITPKNGLFLTDGPSEWMYMLYFTGRTTLNLKRLAPEKIANDVEHHSTVEPVFVHTAALRDDAHATWLNRFRLQQVSPDLPWAKVTKR